MESGYGSTDRDLREGYGSVDWDADEGVAESASFYKDFEWEVESRNG